MPKPQKVAVCGYAISKEGGFAFSLVMAWGFNIVYYKACESLYNTVPYFNNFVPQSATAFFYISLLLPCLFFAFGLLGCILETCGQDGCKNMFEKAILLLPLCFCLCVVGPLVFLYNMALAYPYGCQFFEQLIEKQVVIDYAQGTHVMSPYNTTEDPGFIADCEELTLFNSPTGKEPVAVLTHVLPILFSIIAFFLKSNINSDNFDLAGQIIDLVDLQDFFLLLIEDDIFMAFWSLGHEPWLWYLIVVLYFFNGVFLLFTPLMKSIFLPGPDADDDHKWYYWLFLGAERLHSLFFIELAFLVIRMYCSHHMEIISSSLLIKNFFSAIFDLKSLVQWYSKGVDILDDDKAKDKDITAEELEDEPPEEDADSLVTLLAALEDDLTTEHGELSETIDGIAKPKDEDDEDEDEEGAIGEAKTLLEKSKEDQMAKIANLQAVARQLSQKLKDKKAAEQSRALEQEDEESAEDLMDNIL